MCVAYAAIDEAFGSGGYCDDEPKRDCGKEAAGAYEFCLESMGGVDPDQCAKTANHAYLKCMSDLGGGVLVQRILVDEIARL